MSFGEVLNVLNVLALAGIAVAAAFWKNFISAYLNKKGENLATKEDIGEITKKIESIKRDYAADLESLKAAIGTQLFVHQTRYTNEFDILKNLVDKIVSLRDAALSLRPTLDRIDPNESEEERKTRRLKKYNEAGMDFYKLAETRRPFYPEDIYKKTKELHDAVCKEKGVTPN